MQCGHVTYRAVNSMPDCTVNRAINVLNHICDSIPEFCILNTKNLTSLNLWNIPASKVANDTVGPIIRLDINSTTPTIRAH